MQASDHTQTFLAVGKGSTWPRENRTICLLAFTVNLRPISVVRPISVLLHFPCFVGVSAVLGLGTPNSPFVFFEPQNGPFYTPKQLRSYTENAQLWREIIRKRRFHFHACTGEPPKWAICGHRGLWLCPFQVLAEGGAILESSVRQISCVFQEQIRKVWI